MTRSSLLALGLINLLASPAVGAGQGGYPNCQSGPLASNKVCDTSLDPYTRGMALVQAMTLAEKIQNTQAEAPGVPRLGLPVYTWWNEALHGVARSRGVTFASSGNFSYATSFPQPLTMGAAFDLAMTRKVGETTSTEARAFANAARCGLNFWTPNVNPYRDPRWGRGMEVPSEDAFYVGKYIGALVPELQGGLKDDPYWKLVATCKHFAGYDLENWQGNQRYGFDAKITAQDMRDYYMPPFQSCYRDAKAQSAMCAYNAVNGVPTCADGWLLRDLLRAHWGWNGTDQWVTSDCDSVANVWTDHRYGGSAAGAAAAALNAGCDLDCGAFWAQNLQAAADRRLFEQRTLDDSLARRYASLVRLGFFDPAAAQPWRALGWRDVATAEAGALALRAATEGAVLLANRAGALPLPAAGVRAVAVVGPLGAATTQMQGNYYGTAREVVSVATAFQRAGFAVRSAQGCDVACRGTGSFAAAVAAAREADAVVFVGGIDTSVEAEAMDRNDITWPGQQLSLIGQVAQAAGDKPVVVVQMGSMVDSSEVVKNANVDALLWAGYPGQDGGTAVVNILTGKSAPSGRLPVTQYPADFTKQVGMTDMNLRPGGSNPGRTYKWYTGKPVFEFGHGLHYTNFTVALNTSTLATTFTTKDITSSSSSSSAAYPDLATFAYIPVTVTNTGSVQSDFVVLAFLKGEFGPAPYPKRSLAAFSRVRNLGPGTSVETSLTVEVGSVARGDANGDLVLFPGSYSLVVDNDEKDRWNFNITGEAVTLDSWPKRA